MSTRQRSREVLSTDILIVGGGLSGLTAAIAIKEERSEVDVLVMEKATAGYSGKAPKGGGIFAFVTPEDTVDDFVEYHVSRIGCFLEDQELLRQYAEEHAAILQRLDRWGVNLTKKDGKLIYIKPRGDELPWGITGADLDMCLRLQRRAKKLGVRFIDRICIVDLLKQDAEIVGAIGFNVIDATCYRIEAKATILANGSQNYRIMPMWSSGRGDGIAAAYRAGAEMRNAEFGSFVNVIYTANQLVVPDSEDFLFNAKGEHFSRRYRTHPELEPDICCKAVVGWYKELAAGNGPIFVDPKTDFYKRWRGTLIDEQGGTNRPHHIAFRKRLREAAMGAFSDESPRTVSMGFLGELGPVRVDHHMATTVPGLYAIGDVSFCGSALAGAVPTPPGRMRGSGLMNAVFTGLRGAASSIRHVASRQTIPDLNAAMASDLEDNMFAPLDRSSGITPIDVVYAIQEAVSPVKYSNWKSHERMQEALVRVLDVKAQLPAMHATDPHHLAACVEASAMALCAELFYQTAIERKESRGWFIREDYPETDNENWLKWIIAKNVQGQMKISFEDVPIEKYSIKPTKV